MARDQTLIQNTDVQRSLPGPSGTAVVPETRPRKDGRSRSRWASPLKTNSTYPTILVGVGDRALAAAHEVLQARNGFSILGVVGAGDERPNPWLTVFPRLGTSDDLPRLVRDTGARAVVVACDHPFGDDLASTLLRCHEAGARILDLPSLCEKLSGRVPLQHVEEDWLLAQVWSAHRTGRYHRVKRFVDVAISLAALTSFALIFPALALAIRLSSKGNAILSQQRVGLRGRTFKLYKLRSMVPGAERNGQPVWAESEDSRVTWIGRFLRRTRLDEVPQFWNVLRGEMSVVGPRPERPFFVERLEQEIPHYDWRHQVPPGITGWAQVNQGYAASCQASLRKLEFDFFYIKNRSLGLDLRILFRTIGVVLGCRGAR